MLLKLNPRTLQLVFKRTMAIDIGGMRKPYLNEKEAFDIKDLVSRDPYAQFTHWFEEAKKTAGIEEANAMCIGNFVELLSFWRDFSLIPILFIYSYCQQSWNTFSSLRIIESLWSTY